MNIVVTLAMAITGVRKTELAQTKNAAMGTPLIVQTTVFPSQNAVTSLILLTNFVMESANHLVLAAI